ncbi:MAG: DNA integrity scanning protein DisA nucleotide-binding domain protein [Desulfobacteraceae bacterium]|nr:DNA integrity scanning protein DisA nucleotide-binding domain protein [Desulfobacteraceae bacterium]
MTKTIFQNLCISNIFNGLVEGLSKFSNQSKIAIIYSPDPKKDILIYDPQKILKEHESVLKEEYYENIKKLHKQIKQSIANQPDEYLVPVDKLNLAGLINYGAASKSFFYQMWFTNHHPDMCSVKPTEKWLEHAACLLSTDYPLGRIVVGSSDYILKNYSLQAIADYIIDERNDCLDYDSRLLIPPILNIVLNISKAREEGVSPIGQILFTDPDKVHNIDFITKIQRHQRPFVHNIKHVRKLLTAVENSNRKLVSDGNTIIGITDSPVPDYAIAADYVGDHGFLKLGKEKICSFCGGNFHSTNREAKLVELEELLLDSKLEPENSSFLFQIISELVHVSVRDGHGCTLVIDLNKEPLNLTGHVLDPSLNLLKPAHIDLACSLTKIDGAIHITSDLLLHGFGCLLDGKATNWENMARGARYNSAIRFSAEHKDTIIVVVSSDRPVSIIYCGLEINAFSSWEPPIYGNFPKPVPITQYFNGVKL